MREIGVASDSPNIDARRSAGEEALGREWRAQELRIYASEQTAVHEIVPRADLRLLRLFAYPQTGPMSGGSARLRPDVCMVNKRMARRDGPQRERQD
jgi:hypothetical protein